MAWIENDDQGFRIRFRGADNVRKTIRLTKIPMKKVREIAGHIDTIVNQKKTGLDMPELTSLWLLKIGDDLHAKFAQAGLVEPRVFSTIADFVAGYIREADVAAGTKMNYETVERNLVDYFGKERTLKSVEKEDALAFRKWLQDHEELAENTVRRRCGRARQFFKAAIEKKMITKNPFAGMSVTVGGNTEALRFVTEDEAQKILKACPDLQWRVIFSLCRYGALRCPSEVLALTWENVLWASNSILVISPKTKRYRDKASRMLPMFPQLRSVLDEAYGEAFDSLGDEKAVVKGPVVTRYRDTSQNLRTTFDKIVTRAGILPWKKPFQSLRSTRETELSGEFASHVVAKWVGHSTSVATKHYLQVTDVHFQKAIGLNGPPVANIQGAAQGPDVPVNRDETGRIELNDTPGNEENQGVFPLVSSGFNSIQSDQLPRRDSNPN